MKRFGHLIEQIADAENIRLAFWKASKGKRGKKDCIAFRGDLDANVERIRGQLLLGEPEIGNYHYFRIHDPKERLICAAQFSERVLHHALMNVCEPILENAAIHDSYACRKGKGQLAATQRAQHYARRHGWFLKMDVRKYFDSIDHEVLSELLGTRFKDPVVLKVFSEILRSYQTAPGKGLPIGNLTSQHFANFYLAPLDRFIKENLRRAGYVRYMDDFVVWGGDGRDLRKVFRQVDAFVAAELRLELKPGTAINHTAFGMDFLGYRVFPERLRLARRSKVRFARKFRRYERAFEEGQWSESHLQRRMQSLIAFTLPVRSWAFRRRTMQRFGVAANRLEPRETRRQLEQQRDQLPDGEPQQQQPDEQEQQHRVPHRPAPSSARSSRDGGADPDAIPSLAIRSPGQTCADRRPVPVALAKVSKTRGSLAPSDDGPLELFHEN